MSHTAKISFGGRKGNTLVVVCGQCSRRTVHQVVADASSKDETPEGDIQWWESYLIVQCQGCLELSFCKESQNSEDWDPDPDSDQLLVKRELFPGRIAGRPPLRNVYDLPWELQK